jgi:hypothetical protein
MSGGIASRFTQIRRRWLVRSPGPKAGADRWSGGLEPPILAIGDEV